MKVSKRMRGRVMLVWQNIDSPFFTDEEKGETIRHVLDLATHNGITKKQLVEWCDWLWNMVFELESVQ